jgi:hypothetical protein
MSKCLFLLALLGLVAGQSACQADKDPAVRQKRIVYALKYGCASELAAVLSVPFKDEVAIQAIALPGNYLLLTGKPAAVDEATTVLRQLDRAPRSLIIDVVIAETTKKGAAGNSEVGTGDLDAKTFAGPAESILAKVDTLRTKGHLSRVRRLRISAEENTTTLVQQMQTPEVGATVQVVAQVSPEQMITMRMVVRESRPNASEDGVSVGGSGKDSAINPRQFDCQGTLRLRSGQATVMGEVDTDAQSLQAKAWVIVAARIVEDETASSTTQLPENGGSLPHVVHWWRWWR